jgi:hypothetical protein
VPVTEVVKDWGCHTTEFRPTCRDLDAHIAILDAFFTDNTSIVSYNCSATADGAGSKPPTANPPFLVVDDNETSIALNSSSLRRAPREAVSFAKKHIRLPIKHRYVLG